MYAVNRVRQKRVGDYFSYMILYIYILYINVRLFDYVDMFITCTLICMTMNGGTGIKKQN